LRYKSIEIRFAKNHKISTMGERAFLTRRLGRGIFKKRTFCCFWMSHDDLVKHEKYEILKGGPYVVKEKCHQLAIFFHLANPEEQLLDFPIKDMHLNNFNTT